MMPTAEHTLFDGEVTIKAFGVVKRGGIKHDWSLRHWQDKEKFYPTMRTIARHARREGERSINIFAPFANAFNGEIVTTSNVHFSGWVTRGRTTLWRGPQADGVILSIGKTGFAMSSADCATLIVKYTDYNGDNTVVACHAGRNSLIDMTYLKTGNRTRSHDGVTWSIVDDIPAAERKNAKVWIGLAINPGPHFEHHRNNKENPHNGTMIDYIKATYGKECFLDDGESYARGWLDLKALIRSQLVHGGIQRGNISCDATCTFNDTVNDEHIWYSQVRTPGMRNLILVTRN